MQNNNAGGNIQGDSYKINTKELLSKYLYNGWMFIFSLALSLTVAWLYLRYTNPIYSVSSTLLIRNDNANRSGGSMSSQDMFSDIALFQSNTNKQNEILILKSRSMMERVVKSLQLQKGYIIVGSVKNSNIYPKRPFDLEILNLKDSSQQFSLEIHLAADKKTFTIGKEKQRYSINQIVETPQGTVKLVINEDFSDHFSDFVAYWMPLAEAGTFYSSSLDVKPANDQSNVLSLTYISQNTQLATDILNELMNQYNNAGIEDKNEMNRKILSFINERLNLVETQLDSVEFNLQNYRTKRQVINLEAQSEMYFGDITKLSENLRQQEVQLQVVELLEQYLTQPQNRSSLVPSTLGLTDPTLLELTGVYNKLVSDRLTQLQTGATVMSPIVKNLEKNIDEARIKMIQNLANIKRVYSNNISKLNAETNSLRKEVISIPERERQSREKARQQEIKQNLYLYLMQKREESEIAQASTIANSRIIDTALPVANLVNPIPTKIYGISILIGLLLPILIIYIRDSLNDKVTTSADITKITEAPILGEVGHSEEEKVLLFPENSRSIVAEQIRILRSNLRFVLGDKATNPVILVTSSFSGEGKSFISTNLGAALAISGKRTVILEFDLRKPKIATGLGLVKTHGLTNFLVGSAKLEELVQSVPQIENLSIISCGPVPPNPSELLLTSKVPDLFQWLRNNFDAIVIDTAPVGLVSDAFTLGQFADSCIYVIRQRYTFKRQVHFIDEMYRSKKLVNMGLLVNDVIAEGSKSYYGYGGRYGYGYGYGYGYSTSYFQDKEGKKKGFAKRIKKLLS